MAQRQLQEVTNYTRREVQNKCMDAATAEVIVKKASGKVKAAYRPGYREAAERADVAARAAVERSARRAVLRVVQHAALSAVFVGVEQGGGSSGRSQQGGGRRVNWLEEQLEGTVG